MLGWRGEDISKGVLARKSEGQTEAMADTSRLANEKPPEVEPDRRGGGGGLPSRWESPLSSTVPFPRRGHPRCQRFPEPAGPLDSDFLPRQGSWDEVMAGESLLSSC